MEAKVEIGRNSQGDSPTLATILSQMSWGGNTFPAYEGRCEDTGAGAGGDGGASGAGSAAAGGDSGTSSAAAGSPPAGQEGSGSSTGTADGTGGQGGNNDANLRTLRQNYETLKPWEKVAQTIKDPTAALQNHERITTMFSQGLEMAKALGYTEESYKAAFEDDPVDTLGHLRGEFNKANPDRATDERIAKAARDAANKATEPITQQLNNQQTQVAMQKFDAEFNRLITDDKLGFGANVSDDVRQQIYDMVDSMIPDNVLKELKGEGKVSGIQQVFEAAKTHFLKVINAYNGMIATNAKGNAGQGGQGTRLPARSAAQGGGTKPLTLDDIINSPETTLPGLKSGSYS